jgi:hypothetical protein
MGLDNLITVFFTDNELACLDAAMSEIGKVIKDKAVNLTPKRRQLHGRVADEMEVWKQQFSGSKNSQKTQEKKV